MPRKSALEPPKTVQPDDPAQYQRFIDMAREVGADETPEAVDKAFERVVRQPAKPAE